MRTFNPGDPYHPAVRLEVVVLLAVATAAAVVDWWAVAGPEPAAEGVRRRVEVWAKPLTMTLLIGVAATAGDPSAGVRAWLLVGAVLGLVGDVVLLGDGEARFMAGLVAFALGHIAYALATVPIGFDRGWALVGLAWMAALLSVRFVPRTVRGAFRQGGGVLGGAVIFYGAVITVMVVRAWGIFSTASPAWLAGVGASLFAVSDWLLGQRVFAGSSPGGRLAIMVTYHVGQTLLILGVALA
jgi:uncharacterized membrane protein YhhN